MVACSHAIVRRHGQVASSALGLSKDSIFRSVGERMMPLGGEGLGKVEFCIRFELL